MRTSTVSGFVRIGHRGAAGHAPENTLLAIRKGIEMGVDYVEFDVQRTLDGRLVIMHDKRVDRTTNGQGAVGSMSYEELRRLDAGGGESVPCLEEVFAQASGRTGLMLEIITPGTAAQICAAVKASAFEGRVLYASFHHPELLDVRKESPDAYTLALFEGVPVSGARFALEAQATHVGLSLDSATPGFVETLKNAGLQVFIYTVKNLADLELALRLKVDGVISDYPELILG